MHEYKGIGWEKERERCNVYVFSNVEIHFSNINSENIHMVKRTKLNVAEVKLEKKAHVMHNWKKIQWKGTKQRNSVKISTGIALLYFRHMSYYICQEKAIYQSCQHLAKNKPTDNQWWTDPWKFDKHSSFQISDDLFSFRTIDDYGSGVYHIKKFASMSDIQ